MFPIEVRGEQFAVKIEKHESYLGLSEEPCNVDLKLTISDDDGNTVVIVGMDDEIESLVKAFTDALTTKRQEEELEAKAAQLEFERCLLPKRSFRIRGNFFRVVNCFELSNRHWQQVSDDELIVQLPDDLKTLEDLNWLSEAYDIEWEPENGESQEVGHVQVEK